MSATRLIVATPEAEKIILYIARVSSDQERTETGLINYLIRNGHWSPFEMANMVIEVKTTRAISAQICRHVSFRFQEFSQRYATPDGVTIHLGRRQAVKNRQSSIDDLDDETQKRWIEIQREVFNACQLGYGEALDLGISKEQARFVLPMATNTKIYMNGTLRSWIHYLDEENPGARTNDHVQQEHREIALEIKEIFKEQFPIISKALGWVEVEAHADSAV
jgi:thymidylate synthase (FAD)